MMLRLGQVRRVNSGNQAVETNNYVCIGLRMLLKYKIFPYHTQALKIANSKEICWVKEVDTYDLVHQKQLSQALCQDEDTLSQQVMPCDKILPSRQWPLMWYLL